MYRINIKMNKINIILINHYQKVLFINKEYIIFINILNKIECYCKTNIHLCQDHNKLNNKYYIFNIILYYYFQNIIQGIIHIYFLIFYNNIQYYCKICINLDQDLYNLNKLNGKVHRIIKCHLHIKIINNHIQYIIL